MWGDNVNRDDKFCQYCGHEIVNESDKFCTNCGYDLATTDNQMIQGAYIHNNQQAEMTGNMNLAYKAKNLFNNTFKMII
ncbi:zinc ribbon domain-containing protein [Staphylococcus epidermidis]|uniref:zinc ribbon domain-containing protein n=1 Tax=Staphylococcus epidermidis TaxID=1282 RepID=UPI00288421DD|nr:zinc ribbon domain-containing protein [Staphylococcus epidermidis]MDT0653892.1 zinc ribbon domain-containing protein [Staphylococcus epidermidis]